MLSSTSNNQTNNLSLAKATTNIINPTSMITSTSNIMTTICENTVANSLSDYNIKLTNIKNELMNHDFNVTLHIEENQRYLNDIKTIAYNLPKLIDYSQTKPVIPVFDEIKVLKTDSAEIKKFIRKVNWEMIGFHCNHKVMDEQCDKICKNITDLSESNNFKEYKEFIDNLACRAHSIMNCDRKNKIYRDVDLLPINSDVEHIINVIISLNGKISETNAKTNPKCSRCEATVRKYDYAVREVERMREELREQNEIDEQIVNTPDETKYDFKEFMKRNYPSIDRFPLKDVKDKYKKEFNINKTYAELQSMIEETNMFTVSNSHRTLYVNRI